MNLALQIVMGDHGGNGNGQTHGGCQHCLPETAGQHRGVDLAADVLDCLKGLDHTGNGAEHAQQGREIADQKQGRQKTFQLPDFAGTDMTDGFFELSPRHRPMGLPQTSQHLDQGCKHGMGLACSCFRSRAEISLQSPFAQAVQGARVADAQTTVDPKAIQHNTQRNDGRGDDDESDRAGFVYKRIPVFHRWLLLYDNSSGC